MDTILIIISSLFGGLNILQFIYWRAERRKRYAEADLAAVEVNAKDFELKKDQFTFLLNQLTKYQQYYYSLDEQMRESTRKNSETINQKCNEIAELKNRIIHIIRWQCFKDGCRERMQNEVSDNFNKQENEKN